MPASKGKAESAREYRTKYPDYPSLKLARIMYSENNLLFTNVEDARDSLRYIEGKKGNSIQKKVIDTPHFKEEHRPYNPYNLPFSDSEKKDVDTLFKLKNI